MELEDQAEQKENLAKEKIPQLDVVWKSKLGSQEQYKGSSILITPHDAPVKEKKCASTMEMVDQSVRRCRDGWKDQLLL